MLKFLEIIVLAFFFVLGIAYSGFVFSTIWAYFLVPLGLPALTIPHALGILLVFSYPLIGVFTKLEDMQAAVATIPAFTERMFKSYFFITLVWGAGYLYHTLM